MTDQQAGSAEHDARGIAAVMLYVDNHAATVFAFLSGRDEEDRRDHTRAAVEQAVRLYGERLMLVGDDVAAVLSAAMDGDDVFADAEAVEHANAQITRWVEATEHLRKQQRDQMQAGGG